MQDVTGEPVDKPRPCPYCGSEAEADQDDHSDYESNWTWRVVCCNHADCYAEGEHFKRKEDAIAWWNRRADDADRARLVARIEELQVELASTTLELMKRGVNADYPINDKKYDERYKQLTGKSFLYDD